MYLIELSRERYWFAPDRTGSGSPFVQHPFMIGQLCYSIINARVPQKPPLGVVDEVAVAGKVDGGPNVGSWCPTRFVGATAVAAVDHIEAIYSGLGLRIGGGGNSHTKDGRRQRQGGEHQGQLNDCFHEIPLRNPIEESNDQF